MFASHAINHECLVVLACFRTASSRASFLGVQPAECQKHTEKTRNRPLTCTHAWGILPSLPGIESIAPSSTPTTAPRMLQTAAKTPLGVCACDPHCLLFIGDSRCIRCKPPSFLGLFIELFLKTPTLPHLCWGPMTRNKNQKKSGHGLTMDALFSSPPSLHGPH